MLGSAMLDLKAATTVTLVANKGPLEATCGEELFRPRSRHRTSSFMGVSVLKRERGPLYGSSGEEVERVYRERGKGSSVALGALPRSHRR